MEEKNGIHKKPKYTMHWLAIQTLFVLGLSLTLTIIANGISHLAYGRLNIGILEANDYELLSQSVTYCFALIAITSFSLMLVEISFRKEMNYFQYGLIGCAMCLFFLLLLAMSEKMPFGLAYTIVTVMTIGLICWFVNGITRTKKAVTLSVGLLVFEYGLMLILLYLGSMALLIGSIVLFILIAVAMYFTLKLRIENEELVLK